MSETGITEIRLYGDLAKKFGKVHYYYVASIAEAVAALSANFREFQSEILNPDVLGYKVWSGTERASDKTLHNPVSNREIIRIAPVIQGSGDSKGILSIVIGAALIWATAGMAGGLTVFGNTVSYASMGMAVGTSLIMSGISTILFAPPKMSGPEERESANKPSYNFNGPVNTTVQGHPVPVGYGRLIIGSAVISAALTSSDMLAISDEIIV